MAEIRAGEGCEGTSGLRRKRARARVTVITGQPFTSFTQRLSLSGAGLFGPSKPRRRPVWPT